MKEFLKEETDMREAVNPLSDKYEEMPLGSRKNAASSSQRMGLVSDSYGLVGVKPLLEANSRI